MEIILERETANDESGLIVAVYVSSGQRVEKDDLLFEIENSKANQEVVAPEAGILLHKLKVGQTVLFGVPIAHVGSGEEEVLESSALAEFQHASHPVAEVSAPASMSPHHSSGAATFADAPTTKLTRQLAEPHFSHAAAALAKELGLSPTDFHTDFVTADDVRIRAGIAQPNAAVAIPAAPAHAESNGFSNAAAGDGARNGAGNGASNGAGSGPGISSRKRAEIDTLSKGAGATMLSVLGTRLGKLEIAREPGDFMAGRITDLLIYEASRLMRKYPKLNASFSNGQIVEHPSVHAGMAIDSGARLMVYGIKDADMLSLSELSDVMSDAVARYIEGELSSAELSRATFTVTDLSADELDFVFPLLPQGQSCILGVTQSAQDGFRIFAGFDHRVTEGREVAAFLGELRERLFSFAAGHKPEIPEGHCAYCDRSATDAMVRGKAKGLLKVVNRKGEEVLCCASCWNGW